MMKGTKYYALDTLFPFVAGLTEKILGFAERCHLTRMNGLYTGMVSIVLFNQRNGAWVESE